MTCTMALHAARSGMTIVAAVPPAGVTRTDPFFTDTCAAEANVEQAGPLRYAFQNHRFSAAHQEAKSPTELDNKPAGREEGLDSFAFSKHTPRCVQF